MRVFPAVNQRGKQKKRLKSRERMVRFAGRQFILMVYVVLRRHYPGFEQLLGKIPDHRRRRSYQVAEIIMAGLWMFLSKRGSRHSTDMMWTPGLERNYFRVFGMRLPIMDTVDAFLRELDPVELERLKSCMVSHLLKKKVFDKWKTRGCYTVAFDGSGQYSYDYEPYPGCPHRTSSSGKVSWHCYVLEARIVCANGFSIPLGSCVLDNGESLDQKQDCEMKAFVRLAARIKKQYPRLPILLLADGLYPNRTVLDACAKYHWHYAITLKDKSLPSVWEEVGLLAPLQAGNRSARADTTPRGGRQHQQVRWVAGIHYHGHPLQWVEYTCAGQNGKTERFCHVTDLSLDTSRQAWELSTAARLRWKVENEGFNTQKNGGYAMQHKYSRNHPIAQRNYYQLMQVAHLINQLAEKLQYVAEQTSLAGTTLKAIVEDMVATLRIQVITNEELSHALGQYKQLRY